MLIEWRRSGVIDRGDPLHRRQSVLVLRQRSNPPVNSRDSIKALRFTVNLATEQCDVMWCNDPSIASIQHLVHYNNNPLPPRAPPGLINFYPYQATLPLASLPFKGLLALYALKSLELLQIWNMSLILEWKLTKHYLFWSLFTLDWVFIGLRHRWNAWWEWSWWPLLGVSKVQVLRV